MVGPPHSKNLIKKTIRQQLHTRKMNYSACFMYQLELEQILVL